MGITLKLFCLLRRVWAGVRSRLLQYISPEENAAAIRERFPSCMRGRTMYNLYIVLYIYHITLTHRCRCYSLCLHAFMINMFTRSMFICSMFIRSMFICVVGRAQVRGAVRDGSGGQSDHEGGRAAHRLGLRGRLDARHDADGRERTRRARRAAHTRATLRARRPLGRRAQTPCALLPPFTVLFTFLAFFSSIRVLLWTILTSNKYCTSNVYYNEYSPYVFHTFLLVSSKFIAPESYFQ